MSSKREYRTFKPQPGSPHTAAEAQHGPGPKPDLPPMIEVRPPHPSTIEEEELLKDCEVTFGRSSGPGGRHRDHVETAVTITHSPTGVVGYATERRNQRENRLRAVHRLRQKLAERARVRLDLRSYQPSELWRERRQGEKLPVNPRTRDFPALLAEAMDVVHARRYDVAGSAGILGITMSQLAKLIRHDRHAFAFVNRERESRGLPALK